MNSERVSVGGLAGRAAGLLQVLVHEAPIGLLALDCLPRLAAAAASGIPPPPVSMLQPVGTRGDSTERLVKRHALLTSSVNAR